MPTVMVISLNKTITFAETVTTLAPDSWWRFEETSGNIADEQGNLPDLTASGTPTYNQTGPLGGAQSSTAMQFNNNTNEYFQLQSSPFFATNATTGYQACWIKPRRVGGGGRIMDQALSVSQAFFWSANGFGQLQDFVRRDSGSNQTAGTTQLAPLTPGHWHFCVWQQATANSGAREMWVNGVEYTMDFAITGGAVDDDWSSDVGPTTSDRFGFANRHTQAGNNSSWWTMAEYFYKDSASLSGAEILNLYTRGQLADQTNAAQGVYNITVGASGSRRGYYPSDAGSIAQNLGTVLVDGQALYAFYNELDDTVVLEVEGSGLATDLIEQVRYEYDTADGTAWQTLAEGDATFDGALTSPDRASWTWTGVANPWTGGNDGISHRFYADWFQEF